MKQSLLFLGPAPRGILHELLALRRPTYGCGFVGEDGCCEHDDNPTPECHSGVRCPVLEQRPVAVAGGPVLVALLGGQEPLPLL